MIIKTVAIKGFRNFRDAVINLSEKTLVIGSNDVGKSNLIYALRILLDRSFSDIDIEPKKNDFYAYEETNELSIRIYLANISEECILAKLRENISDSGESVIEYKAFFNPSTNQLSYKIFLGPDDQNMHEIESRFYTKVLNLKFIGSRRDLSSFIRSEKQKLLDEARSGRAEKEINEDTAILQEIENDLVHVNEKVIELNYVKTATTGINNQLSALSYHNQTQDLAFDIGASDPTSFISDLQLASKIKNQSVTVGGDGRNNQIHLALWSSRNKLLRDKKKNLLEVSIFCIEEPEAHLHPHQQRKLASFLSEVLEGQVIITSHSPHIACEVPPSSIIRLYFHDNETSAAGDGINSSTEDEFIKFGYRLNVLASEVFFSDVVFLVEGPSEILFYKAIANKVGVDLDRLNISLLMVDGIGFSPYSSLLKSLRIPFVIRTDNDVFKIPQQDRFRLAGFQRVIEIISQNFEIDEEMKKLLSQQHLLTGFNTNQPPEATLLYCQKLRNKMKDLGMFLSEIDLENDIASQMPTILAKYYGERVIDDSLINEMQKRKATFMFDFLRNSIDGIENLESMPLIEPLIKCIEIAEGTYAN